MAIYDRERAVEYAKRWAYGRNPAYYDFSELGGDCTNFASQALYAGAGVMNYTETFGWYYISLNNRAPAWTGVNQFYRFLTTNTGPGPRAVVTGFDEVMPGDIIQLNFGEDTSFDHSPFVIDAGNRTPQTIQIAAHSRDANCRPLSSYSYTEYRVLHIVGVGDQTSNS